MTWPPAASIRSAADITSITMNGGTSLRLEAESRSATRCLKFASCMMNLLFDPAPALWEPECRRPAVFGRLLGHIPYPAKGQSPNTAHAARPRLAQETSRPDRGSARGRAGAGPDATAARPAGKGPPDPARHRDRR